MRTHLTLIVFFALILLFIASDYARADDKITSSAELYATVSTPKHCGTRSPSFLNRLTASLFSSGDCTMALTSIRDDYYPKIALVVPVYFHVIYKSDGTGNISDQNIKDQIAVLNKDFRAEGYDTMIQFSLEGITRTCNDGWFNDKNENEYKQALGKNQTRYLNVYSNTASGYLGYSYFPQTNAGDTLDGVVVLYETVGGRDNGFSTYNQGRTLVHEIGHYLGLLHTFEGYSCDNGYSSGDLIMDTNPESTDHYSCIQTYSCGEEDPIHNFMNYTPDSCMTHFTKEQANRMVCALINYRPRLYTEYRARLQGPYLLLSH